MIDEIVFTSPEFETIIVPITKFAKRILVFLKLNYNYVNLLSNSVAAKNGRRNEAKMLAFANNSSQWAAMAATKFEPCISRLVLVIKVAAEIFLTPLED